MHSRGAPVTKFPHLGDSRVALLEAQADQYKSQVTKLEMEVDNAVSVLTSTNGHEDTILKSSNLPPHLLALWNEERLQSVRSYESQMSDLREQLTQLRVDAKSKASLLDAATLRIQLLEKEALQRDADIVRRTGGDAYKTMKTAYERMRVLELEIESVQRHSQDEVDALNDQIRSLEAELLTYRTSQPKKNQLSPDVGRPASAPGFPLRSPVERQVQPSAQITALQEELKQREQFDKFERQSMMDTQSRLQVELDASKQNCAALQHENGRLQGALDDATKTILENEKATSKFIREKMQSLQSEMSNHELQSSNQLKEAQAEKERLRRELDRTQIMLAHTAGGLSSSESAALRQEVAATKQSLSDATKIIAALQGEIAKQHQFAEAESDRFKRELETCRKDPKSSRKHGDRIPNLDHQHAEMLRLQEALHQEQMEKAEAVNRAVTLNSEMLKQSEFFQKQMALVQESTQASAASVPASYMNTLQQYAAEVEKLTRENASIQVRLANDNQMATEKVNQLKSELSKQEKYYENEIRQMQEERAALARDNQTMMLSLEELKQELSRNKTWMNRVVAEREKAEKRVSELTETLTQLSSATAPPSLHTDQTEAVPQASTTPQTPKTPVNFSNGRNPSSLKTNANSLSQNITASNDSRAVSSVMAVHLNAASSLSADDFISRWVASSLDPSARSQLCKSLLESRNGFKEFFRRRNESLNIAFQCLRSDQWELLDFGVYVLQQQLHHSIIAFSELESHGLLPLLIRTSTLADGGAVPRNKHRQTQVVWMLSKLEWKETLSDLVVDSALVPSLVEQATDPDSEVSQCAWIVLSRLCMSGDGSEVRLADGLTALISSLTDGTVEIQRLAADCLMYMVSEPETRAWFDTADKLQPVVNCLDVNDIELKLSILAAIVNLSVVKAAKPLYGPIGALDLIASCLAADETELQRRSARALENLSSLKENREHILRHGSVPVKAGLFADDWTIKCAVLQLLLKLFQNDIPSPLFLPFAQEILIPLKDCLFHTDMQVAANAIRCFHVMSKLHAELLRTVEGVQLIPQLLRIIASVEMNPLAVVSACSLVRLIFSLPEQCAEVLPSTDDILRALVVLVESNAIKSDPSFEKSLRPCLLSFLQSVPTEWQIASATLMRRLYDWTKIVEQ
eukprot:GILJ01013410.1.p1 GENE.GILJ01013410.1~~GILJ01013410.1.p1  ORF type:complete len:1166 (+),score=176.78 GILJ01013410.1:49-3498(+)